MSIIKRLGSFLTALFTKPEVEVKKPDTEAQAQANAIEYERLQNNVGRGGG